MAYLVNDMSKEVIQMDTNIAQYEYDEALKDYNEATIEIYTEDEISFLKEELHAKELNLKFQKELYIYKEHKEQYELFIININKKNNLVNQEFNIVKYNMDSSKAIADRLWEEIKQFSNLSDKYD